jgi:transcriptional regulator with XRE-family HTH domain
VTTVRRWSGHEARVLRRALRMSIRAFAEHLGVAVRTVSKWEKRGAAMSPLPDTQAILDVALNRADADAKHRFEQLVREDVDGGLDDVNRRTLLGLLGPVTASPLAGKLEELRRGLDGMLGAEPADYDADDWERTVADYACAVGTTPVMNLLSNMLTDFADIQVSITQAQGPIRRKLIHSASQLAVLTAVALVNAGERHAAQRWWRTAAHAASATADAELIALVHGRHAVLSLYNTPPVRVLELADRAISLGRSMPCVGVISGLAARAQALGHLKRLAESERSLHSVLDAYARLPASATTCPGSQWNWGEQRLHHVVSHVHTYAGRTEQANQAQDAALAVYPSGNFQGRSQIELHRATTLIQAGDIDAGVDHLTSTMENLQPWQRADGIVKRSTILALDLIPDHERNRPSVNRAKELFDSTDYGR